MLGPGEASLQEGRGSGVSGGEKGAVAAPSCREVNREGKKEQDGGKKILTKKCRTIKSKGRWLAKFSSLTSQQVLFGSLVLRGSFF